MRTTPKVAQLAELPSYVVRSAYSVDLTTDQDRVLIKGLRAGAFAPAHSFFVFARGSEPLLPEKTHEVGECHAL